MTACPTCGAEVRVQAGEDGAQSYVPVADEKLRAPVEALRSIAITLAGWSRARARQTLKERGDTDV